LATAIQLPCFRAILALVLRRPVAGHKSPVCGIGSGSTVKEPWIAVSHTARSSKSQP
jgi:hypothetical protein